MTTPAQLPLRLPHRPQMSRADFLVGAANAEALALVEAWPNWQTPSAVLSGPAGAGKTHLVEIWRFRSSASVLPAAGLDDRALDALLDAPAIAIEDIHLKNYSEAALFHLLNLAKERKISLLLTSRVLAADLNIILPDLASRLRTAQPATLGAPDDALLRAVLVKLFADRQLAVDVELIDYILARMERSLDAANLLVDFLDREALAVGGAVNRRLVSRALADLFAIPAADEPDNGKTVGNRPF